MINKQKHKLKRSSFILTLVVMAGLILTGQIILIICSNTL